MPEKINNKIVKNKLKKKTIKDKSDDDSLKTDIDSEIDETRENNNDNEKKNIQSSAKKRGRPKKIDQKKDINNFQKKNIYSERETQQDDEENLILRIPVFEDIKQNGSSEKNIFTMKDDSNDDTSTNKKKSIKFDSLTESDDNKKNSNKSTQSDESRDIKELLQELKRKDAMIKKLKNQTIDKNINDDNDVLLYNNDTQKNFVNMKLVNINEKNSLVICEKTNIACWWCSYNFDTLPCFIPDRYVNDKFYVFGCFCTYNCAMAYNLNMSDYKVALRNSLIKELFNRIFGKTCEIYPAPQKELLQKFGGPMKIEDFRNNKNLCKKEYKVCIPPIVPLLHSVEEIYRDPAENPKNIYKNISRRR